VLSNVTSVARSPLTTAKMRRPLSRIGMRVVKNQRQMAADEPSQAHCLASRV
jgi:hypothetical protein